MAIEKILSTQTIAVISAQDQKDNNPFYYPPQALQPLNNGLNVSVPAVSNVEYIQTSQHPLEIEAFKIQSITMESRLGDVNEQLQQDTADQTFEDILSQFKVIDELIIKTKNESIAAQEEQTKSANSILSEYNLLKASNAPEHVLQNLEQQFAKLAGYPMSLVSTSSTVSGSIGGEQAAQLMLVEIKKTVDQMFDEFKEQAAPYIVGSTIANSFVKRS